MAPEERELMRRQVAAHEAIAKQLTRIATLLEFPPYVAKDEQHFDGQAYVRTAAL